MKTIKEILAEKTKPIATLGPGNTVQDAIDLMMARDIGAVLIVDGTKLIGIFTERDCLHKVTAPGLNPREVPVQQVMTAKVRFVAPDLEVSQGLALMTERFFRHLPVLDEQQNLIGIVSIGDLVKAKISEQDFIIEQMERYIAT
ncbi:MAG: CBS domain-containing protein [Gammaproteobacteria bacterium]|nr:CBS domain-containing protein [Rhodocyclaceae bacterium]MBU3907900.1 CBS domain-containing protein [Gammaproteobacteria bacterium]MBU3988260.1 CBS domain-containing protein [Gammaproteobacteria bacterium]MBU4003806.1 CBS domain-containing protein [Gammaproteobacteria bacterium]MBU4021684.1 CBS domain-containing protein [Gammaproteobacteria bacterium]